eukprot:bmy_03389T0
MNGDQKSDVYAQERQDFIQHFSQIVRVLTEEDIGHPETGDAIARLKEVLEYNAIGGKYHRGLTVLVAFRELVEPRKQDADSLRRALTVGWCVELENYGQKEAEKVARVKALYEEMNLRAVFTQYEEHSYSRIMGLIEQYAAPLPPAIFLGLANKIYKRKK